MYFSTVGVDIGAIPVPCCVFHAVQNEIDPPPGAVSSAFSLIELYLLN
jgi:hypothetical protein